MISAGDISNGLNGAAAMARSDESWPEKMEMGADSVFRSFWAIPLALPATLVISAAQRRLAAESPLDAVSQAINTIHPSVLFLSAILTFILVWMAEIWVLVSMGQRRKMGWKISPMIVAANWSKFAFIVLSALLVGLAVIVGVPAMASFGGMMAYGLLFWLRWGIIRQTLELSPMGTVGMLAALMLVYVAVSSVISVLLMVFGLIELPEAPA